MRLVVADLALLDAALEGSVALSRALGGAEVADNWEVFSGALRATRDALAGDPEGPRWGTRLFLLEEPPVLVGWGGFKGPPEDGVVELGYAIAPEHRGRGVATAATLELLREAFAARRVTAVTAQTLPERNASVRVLEKAGFALDGEGADDEAGTTWRFRLERGA